MQEVGLKKRDFSESCVEKVSKEPQPPLKGLFGKDYFGQHVEKEDPMEDYTEVQQEIQAPENDYINEEFGIHDIID